MACVTYACHLEVCRLVLAPDADLASSGSYIRGAIRGCCPMPLQANCPRACLPKQNIQRLRSMQSAVIYASPAAPGRAPPNPGNTHRSQRTSDYGFSSRHQMLCAGKREPLSNLRSESRDDPDHQNDTRYLQHVHFASPLLKWLGKSSAPLRSFSSTLSAFVGLLKLKSVAATSSPAFQSLV